MHWCTSQSINPELSVSSKCEDIYVTEKLCVTGELRAIINLWFDDYGHSSYQKSKCNMLDLDFILNLRRSFWIITLLSTLVIPLHFIFLKYNYFGITTVSFCIKIFSIPDEELFSETYVACTASYFVSIIRCSRWFGTCIPPLLRKCNVIFAVAEGWLLLDFGWVFLFSNGFVVKLCFYRLG